MNEEMDIDFDFEKSIDEIIFYLEPLKKNEIANECYRLVLLFKPLYHNHPELFLRNKRVKELFKETLESLFDLRSEHEKAILDISNEKFILKICINNLSNIFDLLARETQYEKYNKDILNSEAFYNKKIEEVNKEKEELINEIETIREKFETKTDESEKTRKELEKKEQELNNSIQLIKKYENEKLQNEKINDAKAEWNGKIIAAFENLKKYIKPIKNEHGRLNFLFWGYLIMSIVLIICLFIIECTICHKIGTAEKIPTWEAYLSLIVPIPIAMAGLWGFITLMHRVQRQLVILAKQIHEIEYVEGLLLTTNKLSTNINESMNKVNLAIEKLLENHLKYDSSNLTEETFLEKEEKKDAMPYEEVIKLIKEVTGIIHK